MRKLFEKINNERLTPEEKQQGFLALQNFISYNKPKGISSPFYSTTFTFLVRQKGFAVPITLLLIFAISTGTVFASQNSLPGELLYPVKLLSEGVESATALNAKSKAMVQAKHTITRLTEVEKLASMGTLNNNLGTQINSEFQAQAQKTIQDITTLKNSGALIDAAKISSDFEYSLVNHQERINLLGNDTITEARTRDGLTRIASTVQNQINITSNIQDSLDSSIATSSDRKAAKNYAEDRLKASQEKISNLERHVASSSPTNRTGQEIKTNINNAQNIINQSQQKIGEGSLNDAFKLLKQADQTTEKAADIHDSGSTSGQTQYTSQSDQTQVGPTLNPPQTGYYNRNHETDSKNSTTTRSNIQTSTETQTRTQNNILRTNIEIQNSTTTKTEHEGDN